MRIKKANRRSKWRLRSFEMHYAKLEKALGKSVRFENSYLVLRADNDRKYRNILSADRLRLNPNDDFTLTKEQAEAFAWQLFADDIRFTDWKEKGMNNAN